MAQRLYMAERIFDGQDWISGQAIAVENGTIRALIPIGELNVTQLTADYRSCSVVPAFIDLQIYGAREKLFATYPKPESLELLGKYCRAGGTAHYLPTVATNSAETTLACIDVVREQMKRGSTGILGIHLEGPWLNPARRGAHVESLIHSPSLEELKALLDHGEDVIRMITLAPEVCDEAVIKEITGRGIVVSAGHSNANFSEASRGFDAGIRCATHLFNAMSPLHHREPGLPGAIMSDARVMSSIIPDGYHVDFSMIRIAKAVMGERLFAITDAVTKTSEGYYHHQLRGDRYEANGVLSGSSLDMIHALRNLVNKAGIPLEEAIRMCSLYPARAIHEEHRLGKIAPGYLCALLVLDENFNIVERIFE